MTDKLITSGAPKRHLIFAHDSYYPAGGWGDLEGSTDDLDQAIEYCKSSRFDITEIIDLTTGEEIPQK